MPALKSLAPLSLICEDTFLARPLPPEQMWDGRVDLLTVDDFCMQDGFARA